jgi:hypothetical protein
LPAQTTGGATTALPTIPGVQKHHQMMMMSPPPPLLCPQRMNLDLLLCAMRLAAEKCSSDLDWHRLRETHFFFSRVRGVQDLNNRHTAFLGAGEDAGRGDVE